MSPVRPLKYYSERHGDSMQSTARKKFVAFLLLLALMLSLLTGCTADPTGSSSAPSSDVPPSSDLGSSDVSSNPESPLTLTMPLQGEAMQSTISPWGYVDRTGTFHYSPEWHAAYKNCWPTSQKDTQNIKDGTSGVKSLCWVMRTSSGFLHETPIMYALMEDRTLRAASALPLGEKDTAVFKQHNIDALYCAYVPEIQLPNLFGLEFSEADGATYAYGFSNAHKPSRTNGIASVEFLIGMYLYTDGTIDFTRREGGTAADYFASADFSDWHNLVQIESVFYHNPTNAPDDVRSEQFIGFGLKQDGTVLCTHDAFLPEKFRSNVVRMFDGYVQHRDGSVYDLANRKELGQFEKMDQIFPCGAYVLGVDTIGKVHCLSHKVEDLPKDSGAAWACTLTDVKTVWND